MILSSADYDWATEAYVESLEEGSWADTGDVVETERIIFKRRHDEVWRKCVLKVARNELRSFREKRVIDNDGVSQKEQELMNWATKLYETAAALEEALKSNEIELTYMLYTRLYCARRRNPGVATIHSFPLTYHLKHGFYKFERGGTCELVHIYSNTRLEIFHHGGFKLGEHEFHYGMPSFILSPAMNTFSLQQDPKKSNNSLIHPKIHLLGSLYSPASLWIPSPSSGRTTLKSESSLSHKLFRPSFLESTLLRLFLPVLPEEKKSHSFKLSSVVCHFAGYKKLIAATLFLTYVVLQRIPVTGSTCLIDSIRELIPDNLIPTGFCSDQEVDIDMPVPLTLVYAVEQIVLHEVEGRSNNLASMLDIQVLDDGVVRCSARKGSCNGITASMTSPTMCVSTRRETNFAVTSWAWGEPDLGLKWDIFGFATPRADLNRTFARNKAQLLVREVLDGRMLITHRKDKRIVCQVTPQGVRRVSSVVVKKSELSLKTFVRFKVGIERIESSNEALLVSTSEVRRILTGHDDPMAPLFLAAVVSNLSCQLRGNHSCYCTRTVTQSDTTFYVQEGPTVGQLLVVLKSLPAVEVHDCGITNQSEGVNKFANEALNGSIYFSNSKDRIISLNSDDYASFIIRNNSNSIPPGRSDFGTEERNQSDRTTPQAVPNVWTF